MTDARPRFDDVAVGDALPATVYPVHRAALVRYAGASGDFNPIHWNARFAREVGLPDVIAHGMFTMATAVRLVTDWAGDPAAVLEYGTKFTQPVVVPDDAEGAPEALDAEGVRPGSGTLLEVAGTVAARDEERRAVRVDLTAVCAGAKVLGRAQVWVRLP